MTDLTARSRLRDLLAHREFRALWLAELLSITGDQLTRVALSVVVYDKTSSAALTGVAYALTYVPSVLGGILLTRYVDRFPRRSVMVGADLARAALLVPMTLPGVPLPLFFVFVGTIALIRPIFKSAQLALLPDMLAGERYGGAMALRQITIQGGQLLGFAGGGLLVGLIGTRPTLALDAATFVLSAVLLRAGLRRRRAPLTEASPHGAVTAPTVRVRAALADGGLATLMLLTWLMAVMTVYEGLAVPYAAELGGGSLMAGLLLASDPFGAAVGVYAFSRWVPPSWRSFLIGPAAIAATGLPVLCLFQPSLAASVALFALSGAMGSVVVTRAATLFAQAIPTSYRGHALGLANAGLTTASGVTPLLGGGLADHLGACRTVGWVALLCSVLSVPLVVSWLRRHREARWQLT